MKNCKRRIDCRRSAGTTGGYPGEKRRETLKKYGPKVGTIGVNEMMIVFMANAIYDLFSGYVVGDGHSLIGRLPTGIMVAEKTTMICCVFLDK